MVRCRFCTVMMLLLDRLRDLRLTFARHTEQEVRRTEPGKNGGSVPLAL